MEDAVQSYKVRLRQRGQLTIPQAVREHLPAGEGDILTLLQVGDALILTPYQSRIPALSERFTAEMEKGDVTLAELLEGLAEERTAIHRERQQAHSE